MSGKRGAALWVRRTREKGIGLKVSGGGCGGGLARSHMEASRPG